MSRRSSWTAWARVAAGVVAAVAGSSVGVPRCDAAPLKVTVRGLVDGGETPVVAEIKTALRPGPYVLRPDGQGQGRPVAARVFLDGETAYLATVVETPPGTTARTFTLETVGATARPPGVVFRSEIPNLNVLVDDKPLTTDRGDLPAKPYFYPLVGPTGASYTRAYPIKDDVPGEDHDHFHQRSCWFTHGDVNGVDFWVSDPLNKPKANSGSIKETVRTVVTADGPVGILRTTDDWLGPDGKRVCRDERTLRVFDTRSVRILDFDVTVEATDGPVTFGDTKEGLFGLRVASSMDVDKKNGGKITNAEGVTDAAAWGKASPWVDYSGPVDGKTVGIAILNHPDSFRYPTTWHVRTYGLFAANPFGWHDFGRTESGRHVVPAGGSVRFAYRVILHAGDTASARIADAFQAYAQPATIEITEGKANGGAK